MGPKELQVHEKKQLESKEEETKVGRFYMPSTDIHETNDALIVTMEMPGVDKKNIDIKLDKNVLTVTGNVDLSSYEGLEPVYTEYSVGNYARSFSISSEIDSGAIAASIDDGILEVKMPKRKEAAARKIAVQ